MTIESHGRSDIKPINASKQEIKQRKLVPLKLPPQTLSIFEPFTLPLSIKNQSFKKSKSNSVQLTTTVEEVIEEFPDETHLFELFPVND